MTVNRPKGDKGKCDVLHSRIVRSRGRCERCGETRYETLTTAHIVRRNWSATRCVEDGSWCLDWKCHRATEDDPAVFMALVDATIGRDRYQQLRVIARDGITGSSARFWAETLERLTARCAELGLSSKRAA